ncbi:MULTISPECIES: AMP-dependent synthetase/ligase [Streptomyces]|uniref:Acyl-CoA synthetase n=1 Tax=Streptomyces tsukubensis (strain DSM 42081 / NBRC 108919 / NRRL 18488 / 9993) TaxID=1114943 RepID=I2MZA8_STRT9|nr:AMP-dependent synthetase/ligase [Streptomyces tsukubensis]MYS64526.1 AMP-binding protein [Streptomyces sp. SID5473]AZK94364.1 long-chain fatty acid--CoA ligase [Streptomyces tsukubensis]EIF90105.1 acyl-CoA synthetase [Streptomyces tsukubensis NRRL18488]QKM69542.1 long-chain fatty acid--CoA ligase [Streptomyces tsukubensis NRRL18488]TAI42529.1 long-chain fatty acid--CoA ligase [Streptomyces tsukubensis]
MREFTVPALYDVPSDGNLTAIAIRNATEYPDRAVLARKEHGHWRDVTSTAFLAEVRAVAKGLIAAGVQPGDRIALMSRTRYEWTLFDFAIWFAGAVSVPVYETSSAEQVEWVTGDSGAVACIVETAEHQAVVEGVRERLPLLKHLWRIDAGAVAELTGSGTDVTDERVDERAAVADADSLATIVYTSGTTGRPKGCELTHRNFLAECGNIIGRNPEMFSADASVLLFLPQAHVLGRVVEIGALMGAVKLGHVSDLKDVSAELAAFRPSYLLGVPRVFEKVYNSARAQARAAGKGKIFDKAVDTAIAHSRAQDDPSGPGLGLRLRYALFDKLVYGKLRAALGGRARYAISGGAALGERLGHFYRGLGILVLEGYGLAESCAATTLNPLDRQKIGTVGQPIPGTGAKIAEDGEILLKGEHIFTGYWNNPEATAAVMSGEWFHTGDIGTLDADGYLRITGRKKEIIVTAGGKNVAPAVIEDRIRAHALVAECMVVGEGKPFVGVLVTIDEEFLPRWAAQNGKPEGVTAAQLRDDPVLLAEIQQAVDDGNAAVSKAESVRKFRILESQFTEASGHLTPSLKLKRAVVMRDYAKEIDAIYGD